MQRFMASQLRKPSGWFGSFAMSRILNKVNARIVDGTLAQLDVGPEDDVLEIGFGGGSALSRLAKNASTGVITGFDISPEMVGRAEGHFQREIRAGRLRVQIGDVTQLPFDTGCFDRVFTINTIYFWPEARQGMAEVYRVLREGGRAAVSIRSKDKMEKHGVTKYDFHLFSADDVAGLMRQAGFREIRVDHNDQDKWYDQVIVTAVR